MSLIQPAMLEKQKFTSGHIRSPSYNELVSKSTSIANQAALSTTKPKVFGKRHLDGAISSESKRSRTAPPSPPSPPYESASPVPATKSQSPFMVIKPTKYSRSLRSRSLSPNRRFFNPISPSHSPKSSPVTTPENSNKSQQEQNGRVRLPGISSVLNSALPKHNKLKPIAPTVSLDYFDTYKPNDENWRYELLDTINRGSKHFNLDQYKYLNKPTKQVPLPSSNRMDSLASFKPSFDSRISKKIAHPPKLPSINHIHHERKINFPYESSYTYLNKTYLKDVEKYPEYLELAQSLIQLSQPKLKPMTPPSPETYGEHPFERHDLPSLARPHHYSMPFTPAAVPPPITTTAPAPHYYLPPQGAFTSPNRSGAARVPSISQPTHYNGFAPPSRRQSYETAQTQLQPPVMLTPTIDQTPPQVHNHKFIPISPQSSKSKSRSELLKSPPKPQSHNPRVCISCGSEQSPCWRPSWSVKEGQLCNSCGLRYKKTSARCLNKNCKKIPAKGEWSLMQSKGKMTFDDGVVGHSCLECGWRVEVKKS